MCVTLRAVSSRDKVVIVAERKRASKVLTNNNKNWGYFFLPIRSPNKMNELILSLYLLTLERYFMNKK